MKIFKKIAIISLVGVITAVMLHAKVDGCKMDMRGDRMQGMQNKRHAMKAIFKQLNLSDEQKEMLRESRKELQEARKTEKEEVKLQNNSNIAITDDGVNREAILENAEERARVRATLRADFMENIFNILTDEQKEKFIELLNNKI